MRAATGHNWNGSVKSWKQNISHYGAIHFHEDDLIDCQWDTNLTIKTPHSTKSGYYIARIKAKGIQSDIPFFITEKFRPIKKSKKNKILFLAPTATYLSYSNTHVKFDSLNTENLFSGRVKAFLVPKERSIDIDSRFDFVIAETVYKEGYK